MLIQKTLKEKMPEIEAAMVITDGGELLDYDVSKTFLNENDFFHTNTSYTTQLFVRHLDKVVIYGKTGVEC